MRILHLLGVGRLSPEPELQPLSGLTRTVLNLAKVQAANGHDVSIATFDSYSWVSRWHSVTLVGIAPEAWAYAKLGNISLDYRRHLGLIRFLAKEKFDVVQGHIYSYLRLVNSKSRVVTFHSDPIYYGWNAKDFATARKFSTSMVAVSEYVSSVVSRELQLEDQTVPVVYNGVDCELFNSTKLSVIQGAKIWRQKLGIESRNTVFLYAGAISVEKGARELSLAFKRLVSNDPNALLLIAGSGHLWGGNCESRALTSFEREVRTILADCKHNVHFLENIAGDHMPNVYAIADVVVIPSTVKEGFGLVALESMACGRPVIASNVGGIPEVVNNSCGRLVGPGDIEQLQQTMYDLACQPDLRRAMGDNGVKRARLFSWARAAEKLDTIYRS